MFSHEEVHFCFDAHDQTYATEYRCNVQLIVFYGELTHIKEKSYTFSQWSCAFYKHVNGRNCHGTTVEAVIKPFQYVLRHVGLSGHP